MTWKAFRTDCLVVIEDQKDCASDELLTRFVRSRLVAEKVDDIPWPSIVGDGHLTRPSARFYLRSLQAQLHALKSRSFGEGKDQKFLLLEIYIAELSVHEIGFSQAQDELTGAFNLRFECLSGCLQAIKCWIDVFLTIPPTEYVGFSASIYAMMARCLVDLWRLSTCDYPEWDHDLVRETLDVSSVLEQTQKNFSQVKDAAGFDRGGTSGIGKASVLALAAHNPAHIYFTGRNRSSADAVIAQAHKYLRPSACPPLTFIQCDLSSSRQSIRAALAERFRSDRLDILVANAGVIAVPEGLTVEGFEIQFGTNYLGHAILLQLLQPLILRTAQNPSAGKGGNDVRFVAVSPFGHSMAPSQGIEFEKLKTLDAGDK
ncbi:MAG: hypothetical protein L6R37_006216 [Teloschistes peruensis]|nr:MAG: hypothetical protein L6R37_006216 [Teloschistes peruensis]